MEESVSPASRIEALESEVQRTSISLAEARHEVMEWETTFNASSDAFWILDKDHHVRRSNHAAEMIFQKPVDMMIGRLCCEIVHGTSCPIPECPMRRSRSSLQRETMELHVGDRCYQISVDPILDSERRFDGAVHVVSDITERKRTEAALQQSEAMYRDLVEHSSVLICTHDLDGRVLSANHRAAEALGYPGVDTRTIAERKVYIQDFLIPEARALFPLYIDELKTKGVAAGEMVVLDAQGNRRIWEYNNSLRTEGVEQPIVRGIAQDITERKTAERELRRSEEDFHQLFEAESDAIFLIDNETGCLLRANQAACDMYGYSREELLTMKNTDLSAESEETRKVTVETPPIQNRIIRIPLRWHRRKSGERFPVEITGRFFLREGRPVHIAAIRDITERVKAQEEKEQLQEQLFHAQKLESIGRLAGGVAHDFNNMLAVIMGRAEMALVKAGDSSPIRSDIQDILHASQRSAELVRQLLAFARRQTAEPKVLDLNDIITEMLKMVRRLIGEDMRLTWMPGPNLWPVRIDPAQVDQILANLCVNARDAKHPGKETGIIQIETRKVRIDEGYCSGHVEGAPGDYVMLAVSDDGIGMDREILSMVFEPFFTTKEVGKGTGLGLATVFGIVKQNGGFINVYSEPGHGTTFKIYLPRVQEASVAEVTEELTVRLEGTETVLIVEDEATVLDLAKQILEHYGYRVLAARRPSKALDLARSYGDRIDLLVTDVVMPEMNGKQLKGLIAENHPAIRVLFMSGYSSDVIQQKGILDEGIHFIQKPFSVRGFAEKVRTILG
ncbi:MAG: PAS domain S-box protein [Thermodesulfobacteriota bacterium]